jgi:hypothetical protein
VLEQRIGRVHRLGQSQPVRVVNFVAKGTIEEGMLGVLKFKRSLFAGVLDGGEKDVFLGGSRLNKFMETVEKATETIPEATLDDEDEARAEIRPSAGTPPELGELGELGDEAASAQPEGELEETAAAPAADPWSGLLRAGMALLQQFAGAAKAGSSGGQAESRGLGSALAMPIQRDERTGEQFLKVPVPPPEVLDQALRAVGAFLERLRG